MKITIKDNAKRALSLVLSLVMAFTVMMPAFAVEQTAELGTVEAITSGLTAEGEDKILVTNKEEITLTYAKADPSIGRNKDGWWAGIKVIAPEGLTQDQLKNVKFRKNTDGAWSNEAYFWSVKDSAEDDEVHWVGIWAFVSPEAIAQAEDGKLTYSYEFDWYGNGFESAVQRIDFVIDTEKVYLDHENYFADVNGITEGLTVKDTDTNAVTVENTEEITLDFAPADPSIGRNKDGWWAGIKVVAPAELTQDQLKNVKFRKYTDGAWSDDSYFWSVKDSAEGDETHWVGIWAFVSPEAIAQASDGFITAKYLFDWDDNGFGISAQEITIKLDVTKINLNMEGYLGSVVPFTSGLTVEGEKDITVTNSEEITLGFSKADTSIGRWQDGWWAGIKVIAPEGLTEDELKEATYRRYTADGWSDPISFWGAKDSKEGDSVHYMGAWMLVTPELIAREADAQQGGDGRLTINYEFTWAENLVQKVTFTLDTSKINLDMSHFNGRVEAFTSGLTAEGEDEILVTHEDEITLYFSKADVSIGRWQDGWWAGIKVVAPAELTEDELKNVNYRKYTADGWSDPISFWSAKDSKEGDEVHFMQAWMLVTPELIENEKSEGEDGKLTINYEFDWYGNGFESDVQKVDFELDVAKINLDMTPFLGSVEALTNGITVEGSEEILATNEEEITLTYSKADPSIFRFEDGWWAGIQIVAPAELTEDELKNVNYRKYTADGWSDPISFWSAKDSKEGDEVHFMQAWMLVTPELIENEKSEGEDGKLTINYEFDWDGNGFGISTQKIDYVLDITKINLDMTPFLGSVEALTNGITVEGSEKILATNEEEITLTYSKADPSIFRFEDGWWAGIQIVAPAELTEDELKNVNYRKYTADGWSDPISFWSAKDSKEGDEVHFMQAWMLVTPELIENEKSEGEDGKLTINYEFDWYGNGFESAVQKIDFELDVEKLVLDHENHYGTIEGITQGLVASGETDMTLKNADEITVDFSLADMSVGRYTDAWWIGAKITAPEDMTAEELKLAKYRVGGGEAKSFWQFKDSKDGDEEHFITVWLPVTQAYIDNDADGIFNWTYEFDWDANGFGISTQKFTVSIDVDKINRIHSAGCTKVVDKQAKDPDCVNNGNTEASHCEVCGLVLSVEEVIDALGHTEDESVTEKEVKPDCENPGSYDTVVYCSVCDTELSRVTTEVDALGHDYSEKIIDEKHLYQAKTCTAYAKYFYDCVRCDDMTSQTFENKAEGLIPHEKTKRINSRYLVSAADCENPAKYYMGCLTCDTVFKDETFTDGEPMYHYFSVEKVTKQASINKEGATDFFCADCGKAYGDPMPFAGIKSVELSGTSFSYSGKAITPSVTVKDTKGKTLKKGTDYTVSYSSNTAPGTASVKVTFTGSYTGSATLRFTIGQLPATKKISFTSGTSSVKLTWEKVPYASGYKVYRKTSDGLKEVGSTSKNTLTVNKLTAGKRYTFVVKAYAKVGSKTYVSDASKSVYTVTKASAPKKLVATQTVTTVTLKWSKVSGADSYRVYKYNSKTKKYDFYKTVSGTKLTIKKLKSGTSYKYLVRAVTLTADKVKVTGEAKTLTVSTLPKAPEIKVTTKGGTATVKWSKVTGATGYRIYCMDSKTKKLTLIGTVKSNQTSFKKSGYKKGSKYLFAVRAYKTLNGENLFSEYSRVTVKMK